MNKFWILAGAFGAVVLLTGLLRQYALRVRLLDIPNPRSSHSIPTPRGGGLAVVLVFVLGACLLARGNSVPASLLPLVLLPCILVATVGWLDDHSSLPARVRLLVHLLAAGLALFLLPSLPALPLWHGQLPLAAWSYPLILLGLVWLVNLNNFMDGIDGIASVEAISVTLGAAAILWLNGGGGTQALLLALLAATVAGFLAWNCPPAKIFMGDACSGFLGMAIGVFALATSVEGGINLWSWLILYGVFAVDATCTLLRRFWRGEKLHEAHRSHAYQILARRWQSHRKVTGLVLGVNICWLFPLAVVSSRWPEWSLLCAALALAPLLLGVIRAGAGTTNQ
ncbi:MAG TPA: glycosyl transferase [Desulfobulbaceae bacterium]|nr:glycosyl transferase [Desulfobulbaceae bacterium]